jgi:hypothetical protein
MINRIPLDSVDEVCGELGGSIIRSSGEGEHELPNYYRPIGKKLQKIKNHRNVPHCTNVKFIFTENVIFTQNMNVTWLPKNFCKIHVSFLTVYE